MSKRTQGMIKRTQGWLNVEDGLQQVINQYGRGGNDMLVAMINVAAWVLYHVGGYRSGDGIDWFKRSVAEKITAIQQAEENRQPKFIRKPIDLSDL